MQKNHRNEIVQKTKKKLKERKFYAQDLRHSIIVTMMNSQE